MAISFAPQNANKDNLNIDILVFYKSKRYKRSTGFSIPKEFWNKSLQRCSENRDKFEKGIAVNKALKKQYEAADKAINFFLSNLIIPSKEDFFGKMEEYLHGVDKRADTLLDYMKAYITSREATRQHSTIKTYRSLVKVIEAYEIHIKTTLNFTDLTGSFYIKLRDYIYSKGYSNNYFGRIIKFIRVVFNDAKKNGIHQLPELANYAIEDRTADTIYLTVDELKKINDLELTGTENLVRAKFLLGAYTGLRVSDFNNLDNVNISDRFITLTTQKTGKKIVAPINSIVRGILDTVDITNRISDQKINIYIKEIARKAEINDPVIITKYIAGKRVEEVHEKWELVRSHTARRSFATNSYKAGVPTLAIMKITGHTTEKSFLKYIKISEEENALQLMKHPFFQ